MPLGKNELLQRKVLLQQMGPSMNNHNVVHCTTVWCMSAQNTATSKNTACASRKEQAQHGNAYSTKITAAAYASSCLRTNPQQGSYKQGTSHTQHKSFAHTGPLAGTAPLAVTGHHTRYLHSCHCNSTHTACRCANSSTQQRCIAAVARRLCSMPSKVSAQALGHSHAHTTTPQSVIIIISTKTH
jgi:hypothetical protein